MGEGVLTARAAQGEDEVVKNQQSLQKENALSEQGLCLHTCVCTQKQLGTSTWLCPF